METKSLTPIVFLTILVAIEAIYIPPGPRYRCPTKPQSIYPCKCTKESDIGLNIQCENTNLASLSVGLNNVASYEVPIEELVLYKCHMDHLYGNLFYKLQVRILKIIDTPIQKINEHTFYGINITLNEFHLINSKLNEFPKLAFKVLGNVSRLIIDGHMVEKLDKNILAESMLPTKLERLHFINGELQDLPVESFQALRKLKTLDIHGNKITTLKRNQFKELRDVEVLDISHNNIAKLESAHISDLTKMGWCNVSHNQLTELSRGAFARNSLLKLLNMSNNKIKRLDSNSLRGMRFLRRLYLSDNHITEVGRSTFTSVTRIGTIDLARNLLTKIDYQMFAQLNYVEIIDVSENNVTEIQKQAFKDLYLTWINISHNAISKIEPNSFENCANMTLLDMSFNNIDIIPVTAFDATTYALELQLSYNKFTNMSQVPLQNMTGLKILNVSHNAISDIPRNTFPKLYELHTIDCSYNNISIISNSVFQNLFSLRNLNLSYNSLEVIKPSTFGTLPTLLEMDMSNNKIKDIARGALTNLASLRQLTLENNHIEKIFQISLSLNHLNLKNNWIQDVPEKTWPVMNALLSLDLSGNRLGDSLRGGSFSGLLTLQRLHLTSNGITKVPWESFSPLTTLQYIYLENNNLTELKKGAFGKLPVVFELNLHNNRIFNISKKAFDGLLQLLTLNLSSNALKSIPNEAFYGLVSLRQLDLSKNMLEKIDNKTNGLLDDCLSLQKINLSHNRISFVTRKTFPSNPYIPYRLREIDLSYNSMPVLTFDITFGTKKLIHLDLSHNSINDIRRYVTGNITSLEILDLSHNELTDLTSEPHLFDMPQNLTKLLLNNNNIEVLPVDEILTASRLETLDLRDNKLVTIDNKLIDRIKSEMNVNYKGNPLKCDCRLRPLKHYLSTLTKAPELYSELQCTTPLHLENNYLVEVHDDLLACAKDLNTTAEIDSEEYKVLSDLKFRQITYSNGKLTATWYVTTNKDVADFYINLRDARNRILYEKIVPYDLREVTIDESQIPPIDPVNTLQICVLGKSSDGNVNGWFKVQCQDLPKNFENIKEIYHENYNSAYTILSTDDRIKVSNEPSASVAVEINILLIFISLFSVCSRIVHMEIFCSINY